MVRCGWCMINEIMIEYHDKEWGVPLHDDQKEYEFFSDYLWAFSDNKTNLYKGHEDGYVPPKNGLSDKISKDLKKRGQILNYEESQIG